ncbi:hypothetical protein [Shewanella sp. 0m-4]
MKTLDIPRAKKLLVFSILLGFALSLLLGWITDNRTWYILSFLSGPFVVPILWGFIEGYVGKIKIKSLEGKLCSSLYLIVAILLLLSGIGLVTSQSYNYLRFGNWEIISVVDGLALIEFNWAVDPKDWLGVWNILSKIPLSLILCLSSFYAFHLSDTCKNLNRKRTMK